MPSGKDRHSTAWKWVFAWQVTERDIENPPRTLYRPERHIVPHQGCTTADRGPCLRRSRLWSNTGHDRRCAQESCMTQAGVDDRRLTAQVPLRHTTARSDLLAREPGEERRSNAERSCATRRCRDTCGDTHGLRPSPRSHKYRAQTSMSSEPRALASLPIGLLARGVRGHFPSPGLLPGCGPSTSPDRSAATSPGRSGRIRASGS
jgi:hypothetical protein